MADINKDGVTYTRVEGTQKASPSDPRYQAVYDLSFGNGVDTYPVGGIPLVRGRLGCPTHLDEFIIMGAGASGLVLTYDEKSETLRAFQVPEVVDSDPAAPLEELEGGVAVIDPISIRVKVSGW